MQLKISPSDHASKGIVTAIRRGVIAWRGGADNLGKVEHGDRWSVHTTDVPPLKAALEKLGVEVQIEK